MLLLACLLVLGWTEEDRPTVPTVTLATPDKPAPFPSCVVPGKSGVQVIPGNTTRWLDDDVVCTCGKTGDVRCSDCRYVARKTCPDGRPAVLDEFCVPSCPCVNTLSSRTCRVAVESGSCHGNLAVLRGCRRACGACNTQPCRDIYRSTICRVWRDKGRCQEVRQICSETCGVCSRPRADHCQDSSPASLCQYYRSVGYCQSEQHREAISSQCRRTCGYCDDLCRDEIESQVCQGWARDGHCATNRRVRLGLCKETCGSCDQN